MRHRRDRVDADAVAHRVEIGVAALGDGAVHVRPCRGGRGSGRSGCRAGSRRAQWTVSSGSMPGLQQRQRDHRLDRRAGRVERVQHLVEQRAALVLATASSIRCGRCRRRSCWGRRPASRPWRGCRRSWQSRTTQRARFLAEPARGDSPAGRRRSSAGAALPLTSGLGLELADQLAARGHLDPRPRPGVPRRRCSSVFSSPSLPILKPGRDQQRVRSLPHIPRPRRRRHSRSDGRPPAPVGIEAREAAQRRRRRAARAGAR